MFSFGVLVSSFRTFSSCNSIVQVLNSLSTNVLDGYILPAIAFRFKGQTPMAGKPLHMLVVVCVFLNVRDTHYAKSSLLTPFPLLSNVYTFLYVLKAILKGLKHET